MFVMYNNTKLSWTTSTPRDYALEEVHVLAGLQHLEVPTPSVKKTQVLRRCKCFFAFHVEKSSAVDAVVLS